MLFDLLLITPAHEPKRIEDLVRRALAVSQPQRVAVLLRAKHLARDERRTLARSLAALTAQSAAGLLISSDIELCEELRTLDPLGRVGVQLPETGPTVVDARARLGDDVWIGASRHDRAGLLTAQRDGATFATLSPVFATPDKGAPLGIAGFGALAKDCTMPIVALGGIASADVPALVDAGAAAFAVIRAVFEAADPASAVRGFLSAIDRARV